MRILFLSQLFDPENSIKGLEFARRLTALGHEVEVVTTFPSYPGGRIYPGFRQRWRQVEVNGGVRVVRLPTFISHGKSAAKRLLSYASFGFVAGLYALFRWRRFDVIYGYYPPVMVGMAAALAGFLRRVPFVYDVQDLWPEALVATGNLAPGSRGVRLIDALCGFVYRRAARIVVLSDGYREALVAKGVPRSKVERIYNWCDESRLDSGVQERPQGMEEGRFNILYAGNLGAAQALEHVIDAADHVRRAGDTRVRFVFLGTGVEETRLKAKAQALGLDNVQFLPKVTVDKVGAYLAAADALLVHLADDPVFRITIPQKTQAYLMAGRPILMAVSGEAGEIVQAAGAGRMVEPCQPEKLAAAAMALGALDREELDAMAERGARFYRERMGMDSGVEAVDRMLKSIGRER